MLSVLSLALPILLQSCTTKPEPINYGSDQCDHCRMTIMDNKFGAEIITKKGKIYKFDAAECMLMFVKQGKIKDEEVGTYLVTDASKPAQFTDAKTSSYLISENFPSPMGANLSTYGNRSDAERFQKQYPGEIKDWNSMLTKFGIK